MASTALVDRTKELASAREAAETARREKEEFTYRLAHDLRAPLQRIIGFGDALLEDYGPNLDEKGRHYVSRMVAATQQMAQLIEDLLKTVRTETSSNGHS